MTVITPNFSPSPTDVPGGAVSPLIQPPGHVLTHGKEVVFADFGCQAYTCGYTFTAKTCMELLPQLSDEQLEHEFKFANSCDIDLGFKTKTPVAKTIATGLRYSLADRVCDDIKVLLKTFDTSKIDKLTDNISRLLETTEQLHTELRVGALHTTTPSLHTTAAAASTHSLPSAVSVHYNFDLIGNINIEDFGDLDYTLIGSRNTAYFGEVDYSYSGVKHARCPYPESPALDTVFSEISDKLDIPDFNKSNYTCLVTLYKDGSSHIPFHSDDEPCIVEGSDIVTVSLGATRELKLRSILGDTQSHTLSHGSVHVMTQQSQLFWEHSIPKSSCALPRISLTLRRMTPPIQVPPVHRPAPQSTPQSASHTRTATAPQPSPTTPPKRVLILTDSIHATFPTHIFPSDLVCVKKLNMELVNIRKFEGLFAHMDVIFISCGVNDLSRHNRTPGYLSSFMSEQLSLYSGLYPDKVFIVNSVTSTKFTWLNRELATYNESIFRSTLKLDNVWFLDTHDILQHANFTVLNPQQGIHLTHQAKSLITPIIRRSILDLLTHSSLTRDHWPLRAHYKHIALTHSH